MKCDHCNKTIDRKEDYISIVKNLEKIEDNEITIKESREIYNFCNEECFDSSKLFSLTNTPSGEEEESFKVKKSSGVGREQINIFDACSCDRPIGLSPLGVSEILTPQTKIN